MVVGLAEQLAVLSELSGGIGDTQIYVCFAVSGEEYRFPLYASVLVFRYAVAVVSVFHLFICPGFFSVGDQLYEPVTDGFKSCKFFAGDGFFRSHVQNKIPAAVQDEPVGFSVLVDERRLPVRCMMPDILECRGDDAVEIEAALAAVFRS